MQPVIATTIYLLTISTLLVSTAVLTVKYIENHLNIN